MYKMESFCPLCAKNGIRKRIKAFQINLREAVWACELKECPWPIGYEELTFLNREAISCNWEEIPNTATVDMPALMEFSTLYTPPVTPGTEFFKESNEVSSIHENSSNPPVDDRIGALPRSELIALEDVNSEENSSIANEQIADNDIFKTLPKITNIEKTNINLTICSNISNEYCDNRKLQENGYSFMDGTIMDTVETYDIPDSACYQNFDLNTECKTANAQSENDKLQSNATMNSVETNFGAEPLSETMKTLVDMDVINSLNTTNETTENISDINSLFEDILNNDSNIPIDINDDLLNLLMS